MKIVRYLLLVALLVNAESVFGQGFSPRLMVSGNLVLPMGEFSKNLGSDPHLTRRAGFNFGDNVGLAVMGFGAGVELITPLKLKGFDWILSSRVFVNSTDISAGETWFEEDLGDTTDLVFESGMWRNIPIMTGFRYSFSVTDNLALYLQVQTGINMTKAASFKAMVGEVVAEDTEYEFARDFGYEIGLGIDLWRRFNVGVRYLELDTPRYEGTRIMSEKFFPEIFSRENALLGVERPVSVLSIHLGFYIF